MERKREKERGRRGLGQPSRRAFTSPSTSLSVSMPWLEHMAEESERGRGRERGRQRKREEDKEIEMERF